MTADFKVIVYFLIFSLVTQIRERFCVFRSSINYFTIIVFIVEPLIIYKQRCNIFFTESFNTLFCAIYF